VDINTMFLGGLLPGILLIVLTAAWGIWAGRRAAPDSKGFDPAEALAAIWAAKWELLLPILSLAALFSGWATPVEAAAVTAAYAFVVEVLDSRDLHWWRDCPRVMAEAGRLLIGGILLILGVALGLTNYLIDAQIPNTLAAWSMEHVKSRWLFLLGLNVISSWSAASWRFLPPSWWLFHCSCRSGCNLESIRSTSHHFPGEHGTRFPCATFWTQPVAGIIPV
jgi:TRAP-type C4-dicarboxylate transport system permease large subunit